MGLFIAAPVFRQFCSSKFLLSCLKLQTALHRAGIPNRWHLAEDMTIEQARNDCVHAFLQSKFERLLFIDDDMEFEPDDVRLLLEADKPVISGVYALRRRQRTLAAWKDEQTQIRARDLNGGGPFPVKYAGAGFLLIDRHTLTTLAEASPEYRSGGQFMRKVFDTEVRDGLDFGEDYAFCAKCADHGIPVHLHPDVRVKHWGPFGYDVGH